MKVGIQYFKPFCKGKYMEKEALADEENHGFII
jgi:hypothetical protein